MELLHGSLFDNLISQIAYFLCVILSGLSRPRTAWGLGTWFSLKGPTKVKACKALFLNCRTFDFHSQKEEILEKNL